MRATATSTTTTATTPAEIDTLNQERTELETLLSSGSETDVTRLTEASQRIGTLIAQLDEKELRWLELDELING